MGDSASAPRSSRARALWSIAAPPADWTRDRTAAVNQLLLGAVVFVSGVIIAVDGDADSSPLFFGGAFLVLVLTGATLIIPWNRIRYGWMALVPALDIVAIAMMQLSHPTTGFGLLWFFPTTWLAAGFGVLGMLGVVVAIGGIVALMLADPRIVIGYETLLLPLVLLTVATTSFVTARRSAAQRAMLTAQARLLHRVLDRTRRQEQEVTEVLDAVDFGVIRIAADGSIAVTNDAHGRLQHAGTRANAEQDAEEPSAYRDDGLTPLPHDELPLERALRGEEFDDQLVWFGGPDEPQRALSVTTRRVRDETGTDAGAVVISRDVTAELTALRARDDLVASVSHELRTPLTSILGYLDLVIDDPEVPATARANLEIAERNAERLLRIIADILAASSSSATSELTIARQAIDARDVVRAAAESLVPRADEQQITIDTSGLESASVFADPHRLRQVIDNLIANAIKYNRRGGTVYLATTTDGESSWVVVRDTGAGISESERARLFHRYYRGSTSSRRTYGTGLGLAISRDIIRAHGGEIAVRSAVGAGSTFVVKVPALPPTAAEASATHDESGDA